MDGSNFNNSDIYFGKKDDEEDEDALAPYDIQTSKVEFKPKPKFSQVTIKSTSSIDNQITSQTKKNKKKTNDNVSKSIQNKDSNVKQAEFYLNHGDSEVNEHSSSLGEEVRKVTNDPRLNITTTQNRVMTNPPLAHNQTTVPNITPQQPYINYPQLAMFQQGMVTPNMFNNIAGQRMVPNNSYLLLNHGLGNQPRYVAPQPVDNMSTNNYSLTATYNHRLHVIDTLFRFIMQILRTPEQPQVQQIELLKQLLDSMVIPKPQDTTGTKQ